MMRRITACRARWLALAAAVAAVTGCGGAQNGPAALSGDGSAELKWARPVAEDFLAAMAQGNKEAGANLLSKGFEARLRDSAGPQIPIPEMPVRTSPISRLLGHVWIGAGWAQYGNEDNYYRQIAGCEIRGESLAPDRREAAFDGMVKMKDGKEFKFRVRVVPEGEGGRWRVDSIMVTE